LFIKYNSAGTIIQQKAWGGANLDEATGIALDTDGNIYVIGNTYNFGARGSAIFLLQYKDSDGSLQWQKKWDGVVNDFVRDMAITSSGIYLTGETESGGQGGKDILLLKYNFGGSVQWAKAWGDTRSNTAYGIDSDSADNIYICGSTSISSTIDSLLLKYNSSGTLVWSKIWRNDQTEIGRAVAVDPSSSAIYVVGETNSEGASDYDALI
ncbi:MAG: SBBP repeat-containing protein, partial [Planctomycetes bacterium]|nr:SBBP repeat-containing protein [Planctomycetota bacterium]